jgi:hypothetical protein
MNKTLLCKQQSKRKRKPAGATAGEAKTEIEGAVFCSNYSTDQPPISSNKQCEFCSHNAEIRVCGLNICHTCGALFFGILPKPKKQQEGENG